MQKETKTNPGMAQLRLLPERFVGIANVAAASASSVRLVARNCETRWVAAESVSGARRPFKPWKVVQAEV